MPRRPTPFNISAPESIAVRKEIRALLDGADPSPVSPFVFGRWAPLVAMVHKAHGLGGTEVVRQYVDKICRELPSQVPLLLGVPDQEPVVVQPCPPLPPEAAALVGFGASCGYWLNDYIHFATAAAPMTPPIFHEAAGLFLASLAVGRRLVFHRGLIPFYPNLYFLWVAPTTLYRKSTSVAIFTNLLRRAGLHGQLLSEGISAEALLQEMSLAFPDTFAHWTPLRRDRWIAQRALASQRAVLMDEASFLFDNFGREGKSMLLSLLLRLYDCPEEVSEHTIARGLNLVERPSLSFFGITTPAGMEPHFRNTALWSKGLWRRFILLVPDSKPIWNGAAPLDVYPDDLVAGLVRLHHMFPIPTAELARPAEGDPYIAVSAAEEPSEAILDESVVAAWQTYARVTGHDMLLDGSVDESLHGSYGGLATHAIKVALLLAAMDAPCLPVTVELVHFTRAVAIVETWRRSLHRVRAANVVTEETRRAERLLALLAEAAPNGLTTRTLCQRLHLRAREVVELLTLLHRSGQVAVTTVRASNGKQTEIWTLIA